MEGEGGERLVARVAPLEDERAGDRPLLGIEPGLDRVARVARRDLGQRRAGPGRPVPRRAARGGGTCAGAAARAPGKASAAPASAAMHDADGSGAHDDGPRGSAVPAAGERILQEPPAGRGRSRGGRDPAPIVSAALGGAVLHHPAPDQPALPARSPLRWRFMDPPDCVARTRLEFALPGTT